MKKRVFLLSIVALFVSAIITISTPTQTHADAILDIAAFTDLYKCYKEEGKIQPNIKDLIGDFHDISKYIKGGGSTLPLPNAYQHTVSNNGLSCYHLVTGLHSGKQSFTGIISDKKYSYSQQEMINFLPKVGYNEPQGSGNNSNNPCASFIYTVKASGYSAENEKSTNQFCVSEVDSSSKITSNSKITINSTRNDAGPKLSKKDRDRAIKVQYGNKIALVNGETFEEYVLKVYNEIRRVRPEYSEGQEVTIEFTLKQYDPSANITGGAQTADGNKVNGEWKINNMETAADIAIKNFSSFSSHNDLKFTSEQKSTLYKHYLKNWYGATVICEGDSGYENLLATAIKATNVTSKNCFVNATEHKDDKVHGIKSDMTWYQDLSLEQLVAAMSEEDILGANTFSDPEEGEESAEEDRKPDCHTKAGALGWILCPVIAIASDTVEKVYTDLIMPYLSIDAALFDLNEPGGEAVRNVWSLFQGFANLAFVILFLFVIFSQLSGVGIDNYGIKKILPKLIIGAVLINLSYIICQLAVDLSNILGRAIADMFSKFAEGINNTLAAKSINLYPGKASDVPGLFSDIASNKAAIVVIAGALGLGAFLAAGPAIIIPAVLALISVVIGIFFLFVLLALRQAIAVILVVVSPMAFAMYILPNTKSIFDKWYQTFKGMLLAFPIASALVFGGDFVSKILLAAEGSETITSLGLVLSAAAVAVAPIFFIPDVIRKSMGALSGIANFVQRGQQHTTSRLGKGASDGIRNSGLQRTSDHFRERFRAGVNKNGEISTIGRIQNKLTFTSGQRAKIAERRSKALGNISADKTNRRMLTEAGIAAAGAGIAAKARQQEINDEITNMAKETGNYNTDVMEGMLAGYMSRKDLTNAEEMKAKALMTKLSQAGGDGNKRLANIIRGKVKDKNGNSVLMSDAGRKLFADYATNSDVANNISSKDAYVAQYLRDMQAEQAESGSTGITNKTTFDQWAAKSDSAGRNMSNEEFVATKQLDDDEYLMRQSGDSLHQTVGIQGAVTQERAQRILDNDNINKKQSQINELETTNAKMKTSSNNGNNNNNNNNGGNKNNGNNNNGNGNNNNNNNNGSS